MAKRIRVYEVAKDLGMDSKDIIAALDKMGTTIKNHMAALDDATVEALKNRFAKKPAAPKPAAPKPPASPRPPAAKVETPTAAQVKQGPKVAKQGTAAVAGVPSTAKPAQGQPQAKLAQGQPQAKPGQAQPQARPAQVQPQARVAQQAPARARPAQQTQPQVRPAQQAPAQAKPAQQGQPQVKSAQTKPVQPQVSHVAPVQGQPQARPVQQAQPPAKQVQQARPAQQVPGRPAPRQQQAPQGRPSYGMRSPGPATRRPQGRFARQTRQRDQRARGQAAAQAAHVERQPTGARRVTIQGPIVVRDLASLIGVPVNIVLRTLMSTGVLISINQNVPPEIAVKVAEKLGCVVTVKEPEMTQEQAIADELNRPDDVLALVSRPPVVTVMGHVDHGKTSLLDAIRHTNVTAKEAGGITQHIGASVVEHGDNRIIFLDTPGHEAFTAMRARGAKVTDVAVLVVAADDGVMPQTIEAMNHAKAADVPIIVALNKIDKPGAKPDRVKQQLADNGLVPEEWGGETVVAPVSAKTGEGVQNLLEMIVLVSEMQEIKTDPTRKGRGHIIESEMDKGRGPVATALIKAGSLRVGDAIITDTTWGRIRSMYDARGRQMKKAGPATPVEIVGLAEVPQAGDVFLVVDDERTAKEVTERRKAQKRAQEMQATRSTMTLEELFAKEQEGAKTDLRVIVKCDVQGSLEAILQALGKMEGGEVKLDVIHSGVGGIIESDVTLAKASDASILGFNVRPFGNAAAIAEANGVEIRTYRIIYDLLDDVNGMLKGLVKPKTEEVLLGHIEVRQTFHVPKIGTVAGCYVTDGKVPRSASVRLLRDGVVTYEGKMASLRRFKDDVPEVSAGYECGVGLDKFQDVKIGDVIEAFAMKEIQPA